MVDEGALYPEVNQQDMENQPKSIEKMLQVMTQFIEQQKQYIESQMADRAEKSAPQVENRYTIHKQFMKLRPPPFAGAIDPLEAECWIKRMESIFEVMGVHNEKRVMLATFMLNGEAQFWWEETRRFLTPVQVTWDRFVQAFQEKYFPLYYQYEKEKEFIMLTQGTMTVAEYEAKFTALSRFATEMVWSEEKKCRRFRDGLEFPIVSQLSVFQLTNYADLVRKALIAERNVGEMVEEQKQSKKSRLDVSQQKRQAEGTFKQGVICYRCGVEGHISKNCPQHVSNVCFHCHQEGHIKKDCVALAATSSTDSLG